MRLLYRDNELTGFGLRVGTRAKTYFAEGQIRRRTVGRFPLMTPEVARRLAFEQLAAVARGVDPGQERKTAASKNMTVAEAFEAFFEARLQLSVVTIDNYQRTPRLYIADWRSLPLHDITRGMVLARHRKISAERGGVAANNVFRHLRSVYNFVASLDDGMPSNPVQILSKARAWAPERRRRRLAEVH